MRMAGVHKDERPSPGQVKAQRPRKDQLDRISCECIGQFEDWLKKDLKPAIILNEDPGFTVKPDKLRVPFTIALAEVVVAQLRSPWFLMDFTFETNVDGIVIGSCGPVALHPDPTTGEPSMRYCPAVFLACETEDQEAHQLLMREYMAMAPGPRSNRPAGLGGG